MQIKTTMRLKPPPTIAHPFEDLKLKRLTLPSVDKDMEQLPVGIHSWLNVKCYNHFDPAVLLADIYPREVKACIQRFVCECHSSLICHSQILEVTQMTING